MTKRQSPAIRFISLAWGSACSGVPHSWQTYNQTVGQAAQMAAKSFRWDKGDIDELLTIHNSRCTILKCLGEGGLERLYSIAVRGGNMTFCEEYERWVKRAPIIMDGVNGRQRDRLCIGSTFKWKGEQVTVTSWNQDGSATACSYKTVKDAARCSTCNCCHRSEECKIWHRHTITREAVIAERAERKRRQEIWDALADERSKGETESAAVINALGNIGVATGADFDRAPLKKLESVLKRFQGDVK